MSKEEAYCMYCNGWHADGRMRDVCPRVQAEEASDAKRLLEERQARDKANERTS